MKIKLKNDNNVKGEKIVLLLRPLGKTQAWRYTTDYIVNNYDYVYVETMDEMRYYWNKKIDTILIPYNYALFDNLQAKFKFLKHFPDAKFLRMYNEYNLRPHFGDFTYSGELICNFRPYGDIKSRIKKCHVCNVNCLIYRDIPLSGDKKYDIIYYGTYRIGRKEYFEKYFDKNLFVSISSLKAKKRYLDNITARPQFIDPLRLDLNSCILQQFRFSLYIEDNFTHTNYNFPANRYYEALTYGVVLLFDKNCKNTFDTYGIDISRFMIDGKEDLQYKMNVIKKDYNSFLSIQNAWKSKIKNDLKQLKLDFDKIL
jgi:hypothetical protein